MPNFNVLKGKEMRKNLSTFWKSVIVSMAITSSMVVFFNSVSNNCRVKILGSLQVKSRTQSFFNEMRALESVPIKISIWVKNKKRVIETITSDGGDFYAQADFPNVSENNCRPKKFKVKSSFVHGEKLSITKGDWDIFKTWDTIANHKTHPCNGRFCDLGSLTFGLGGIFKDGVELGKEDNYRQADAWWASIYLINYLEMLGFPFKDRLKIAYPFDEIGSSGAYRDAYANPITRQVQLVGEISDDPLGTLLYHEIGHIWLYEHSQNAMDLASYFILNSFSTHGMLSSKSVAFHEAFAEVFGNYIFLQLLKDEGKISNSSLFYDSFLRYGMLMPKALQNFTFSHPNLNAVNSVFINEANLISWQNSPECKHHEHGTFDCSDPGWMSIMFSLLLENESNDIFENSNYINLIHYNLMKKYNTTGQALPMNNFFTNDFCQERPRLTFSDFLTSVKGNGGEDLIDSSDMSIDGYFSRIRKMELGNLSNDEFGIQKLSSLKDTLDVGNKNAGSFYHQFCRPALFTNVYQGENIHDHDGHFDWNDNFFGGTKAVLTMNLFVKPTEDVRDIVTIKTELQNNLAIGEVYFRDPDETNFYNGSSLTDYKLMNTFNAGQFKLDAFSEQTRRPVLMLAVELNDNGSFPVTHFRLTPEVGCREFDQFIFFQEGAVSGNEAFWNRYNCRHRNRNSINKFLLPNGDLDWGVSGLDLTLGADFKPTADSLFYDPNLGFSASLNYDRFDPLSSLINKVNASEKLSNRQKNIRAKALYRSSQSANRKRKLISRDNNLFKRGEQTGPFRENQAPKLDKNLAKETYLGICRYENIGNVRPGVTSRMRIYTYTGEESNLKNDRDNWNKISEQIVYDLKPGYEKLSFEMIDLPSVSLLMASKALLPQVSTYVKVSDPVFLICETDSKQNIDELSEENNISITKIREAIHYSSNTDISENAQEMRRDSTVANNIGVYHRELESLKNAVLKNDVQRASEIYRSIRFKNYRRINRANQINYLHGHVIKNSRN